jgi:hypothetical protein
MSAFGGEFNRSLHADSFKLDHRATAHQRRTGCNWFRTTEVITDTQNQPASPIVLPRRNNDAIQDIVKDRHRRCEVEPDKLRAVWIKRLAGTKSDPCIVEKELEGRGRKPDADVTIPLGAGMILEKPA